MMLILKQIWIHQQIYIRKIYQKWDLKVSLLVKNYNKASVIAVQNNYL
jgi:hypothetical protein